MEEQQRLRKIKKLILEFLTSEGSSKAADIALQIDLSPARTSVLISELAASGKILPEGNGRSRRYRLL